MNENRPHTNPVELNVARAPEEIARLEGRNGLLQTDKSILIAFDCIEKGAEFKMRPSMIMQLHSLAMEGLTSYAGTCRPGAVEIQDSSHVPPDAFQVLQYLEELCDYINENWTAKTPIHLAAYAMWRMNWIHPFTDGNGRTARAVTFVVLSVAAKCVLTTPPSIPQQIVDNRQPYFEALEEADRAWKNGEIKLEKMENLLKRLFQNQIEASLRRAIGNT